jgi:hypothetical protein
MLLFSFFSERRFIVNLILVAILGGVSSYTLVSDRKHYSYFYKTPFDSMVKNTIRLQDSLGKSNVSVYLNAPDYFKYYYEKKYGRYINSLPRKEFLDIAFFKHLIDSVKTDYFVIGNPHHEYLGLIRDKFPRLIYCDFGNTLNYFCFAKGDKTSPLTIHEAELNLLHHDSLWEYDANRVKADTLYSDSEKVFSYANTDEYGLMYTNKLWNVIRNKGTWINASASVLFPDTVKDVNFVIELNENGKSIFWKAQSFATFEPQLKKWTRVHFSIEMNEVTEKYKDPEIKIYIWNQGKTNLLVKDVRVFSENGNINLYKQFEKME